MRLVLVSIIGAVWLSAACIAYILGSYVHPRKISGESWMMWRRVVVSSGSEWRGTACAHMVMFMWLVVWLWSVLFSFCGCLCLSVFAFTMSATGVDVCGRHTSFFQLVSDSNSLCRNLVRLRDRWLLHVVVLCCIGNLVTPVLVIFMFSLQLSGCRLWMKRLPNPLYDIRNTLWWS